MTPVERTEAIKDKAASELPALLTAAGLDDFDEYLNKHPLRDEDKEFCVYIDFDDNSTDKLSFGVLIHCQIYGDDQAQEYHSVIMPWLETIRGSLVGFTERENISADIWPVDINTSTSFIYYAITFGTQIDDCYE